MDDGLFHRVFSESVDVCESSVTRFGMSGRDDDGDDGPAPLLMERDRDDFRECGELEEPGFLEEYSTEEAEDCGRASSSSKELGRLPSAWLLEAELLCELSGRVVVSWKSGVGGQEGFADSGEVEVKFSGAVVCNGGSGGGGSGAAEATTGGDWARWKLAAEIPPPPNMRRTPFIVSSSSRNRRGMDLWWKSKEKALTLAIVYHERQFLM